MTTDCFEITADIDSKPLTRRGMLSMMSQCFDPLGFIQPFVLPAKRILQDLCSSGYSWDDPVTGEPKSRFQKWVSGLPCLNQLSIPRCYKPPGFTPKNFQLHCFCDASNIGYGAVAYLRMINEAGEIHCAFIKGCPRVTPLKPITIPRLELISAVCATDLVSTIRRELDCSFDSIHYWTDSTSVLQMINNRTERFKTFVANRIALIHSVSSPSQWNHIRSELNPADVASRGVMPNAANAAKSWLRGPEFLVTR